MEVTITKDNQKSFFKSERDFTEIKALKISKLNLKEIPPDIGLLFPNLISLDCSDNLISDLSPIEFLHDLQFLKCSKNKITNLRIIEQLNDLISLDCSFNLITDINSLRRCKNLTHLLIHNNNITSLQPLIYLQKLKVFNFNCNPLNHLSIQVSRFLERLNSLKESNDNILNITTTTLEIVDNVLESKCKTILDSEFNIIMNSVLESNLKEETKKNITELLNKNDFHNILLLTYKELFCCIWKEIIKDKEKITLIDILECELNSIDIKDPFVQLIYGLRDILLFLKIMLKSLTC